MDDKKLVEASLANKRTSWDAFFAKYDLLSKAGVLEDKFVYDISGDEVIKKPVPKSERSIKTESKEIRKNNNDCRTSLSAAIKKCGIAKTRSKSTCEVTSFTEDDCKENIIKNCSVDTKRSNKAKDKTGLNCQQKKQQTTSSVDQNEANKSFYKEDIERLKRKNDTEPTRHDKKRKKRESTNYQNDIEHVRFVIETKNKSNLRKLAIRREMATDENVFNKLHKEVKAEMARLMKLNVSKSYLKDYLCYVSHSVNFDKA